MDKSSTSSSSSSSSPGSNDSRDKNIGCGTDLGTPPPITLNITTTTGGSFSVLVDVQNSVENLKKIIAQKLKVAKDRICLLHRERELQDGNLKDNGLVDGSKIILIPNVETGLLAQRPENTVMQALESLNDSQVNDFLSGKTPLNLSMRLGDHMMLIQLQLSTVNPSSPSHGSSRSRSSQRSNKTGASAASTSASAATSSGNNNLNTTTTTTTTANQIQTTPLTTSTTSSRKLDIDANNRHNISTPTIVDNSSSNRLIKSISEESSATSTPSSSISTPSPLNNSINQGGTGDLNSFLSKHDFESLQNIVKSLSIAQQPTSSSTNNGSANISCPNNDGNRNAVNCCPTTLSNSYNNDALLEQSPIKSLSNLVSSPIKTTPLKNIPISNHFQSETNTITTTNNGSNAPNSCSDPISAKLTSCLCKRLDNNSSSSSSSSKNCEINQCQSRQDIPSYTISSDHHIAERAMVTSTPNLKISSSSLLHKTANNPIGRSKHRHYHHHHHHHHHSSSSNILRKNISNGNAVGEKVRVHNEIGGGGIPSTSSTASPTSASDNSMSDTICDIDEPITSISATDSRALAEASRNLTQTLRKLSKEVFTNKVDLNEDTPRKSGSGAVIESMKNHGKGIYSGTFSGTLNPALQDRYGRPKRDISTVIHILNDLLSATPQYSRGARISFEPPSKSSNKQSTMKHQAIMSSSQDSCGKCLNSSKISTCAYGECGGHYTNNTLSSLSSSPSPSSSSSSLTSSIMGVSGSTASNSSFDSCQRNGGECHIAPCGCHDISGMMGTNNTSSILDGSSVHMNSTASAIAAAVATRTTVTTAAAAAGSVIDNRSSCTCSFRCINSSSPSSSLSSTSSTNTSSLISSSMEGLLNIGTSSASALAITTMANNKNICSKCSIEIENNKTKCKLDQLRLVMQQRKERREARKLKGAPYGARVVSTPSTSSSTGGNSSASTTTTATAAATASTIAPLASPSEVSPNHIVEEVDTAA